MALGSISALGSLAPLAPLQSLDGAAKPAAATGTDEAGKSFAATLADGLQQVQQLHERSDGLAVQAATGDLRDVHDYMIASTEAGLATEMTVAFRNKAVEAFTEIMRMPL